MKNECYYDNFDRKENLAFDSKVVHGGQGCDPITGAVSFPIFQTATFRHRAFGISTGYDYTRVQNPTRQELERTMAILENGLEGFAFSSGQAANMALFTWLPNNSHVILSDDIYGGTFRICDEIFSKFGCTFSWVDLSDLEAVRAAIRPETKMIYAETPTNPMMKVADIAALSDIAHSIGALMVVDNTFMTPYFQRPLDHGADVVIHSGTKYLGGHNDTIAGIAVVKSQEMADFFHAQLKSHGNGLAPMDCWLLLRGIKTLAVRMERAQENALAIANWLKTQPKVKKVYYVGLPEHPGYDVNRKQSRGSGAMLSFTLDSAETALQVLAKVKVITFAESLGGPESLITLPATQTHADISPEDREKLGITDSFLRMSVGLENAQDLIADLQQAMA